MFSSQRARLLGGSRAIRTGGREDYLQWGKRRNALTPGLRAVLGFQILALLMKTRDLRDRTPLEAGEEWFRHSHRSFMTRASFDAKACTLETVDVGGSTISP